jgi:hypothetical protein
MYPILGRKITNNYPQREGIARKISEVATTHADPSRTIGTKIFKNQT